MKKGDKKTPQLLGKSGLQAKFHCDVGSITQLPPRGRGLELTYLPSEM